MGARHRLDKAKVLVALDSDFLGEGPEHKRLMLLGTAAIILPALARWPFNFMQKGPPIGIVALYLTVPTALGLYDLVTLRRVHRATIIGAAVIFIVIGTTLTIPSTAWWRGITLKVQQRPWP